MSTLSAFAHLRIQHYAAQHLPNFLLRHTEGDSLHQPYLPAKVLAALRDTAVPVPRALCLATDSSIIGTPFYVMQHVQVSAVMFTFSNTCTRCSAWPAELHTVAAYVMLAAWLAYF